MAAKMVTTLAARYENMHIKAHIYISKQYENGVYPYVFVTKASNYYIKSCEIDLNYFKIQYGCQNGEKIDCQV